MVIKKLKAVHQIVDSSVATMRVSLDLKPVPTCTIRPSSRLGSLGVAAQTKFEKPGLNES
jgi:hypothetical protein